MAEVKYVNIGELSYPIKLTNRAMIEYEKLTGETIISFRGSERLSQLFFVTAKAGAKATGQVFEYDYEAFLDLIDDYYIDVLNNFSQAIFEDLTPSKESSKDIAKKKVK